jgi:hypothetical protein
MLEFHCEAIRGEVEISEVVVSDPETKRQIYFEHLDERVQNALLFYLTERGLYSKDFARLIFLLLNRYDHEYYVTLLKNLQLFFKA